MRVVLVTFIVLMLLAGAVQVGSLLHGLPTYGHVPSLPAVQSVRAWHPFTYQDDQATFYCVADQSGDIQPHWLIVYPTPDPHATPINYWEH